MTASAWADYLDARGRLVHAWAGEGLPWREMVERLTPTESELEGDAQAPDDALPGSSRDLVAVWQARAEALEEELHSGRAAPTLPLRAPVLSEVRGLLPHSDPLRCGCQHWTDPPPAGQHHAQCVHGSGVKA